MAPFQSRTILYSIPLFILLSLSFNETIEHGTRKNWTKQMAITFHPSPVDSFHYEWIDDVIGMEWRNGSNQSISSQTDWRVEYFVLRRNHFCFIQTII